jgi:DNA-binding XRE family transcriptional regulator
MAKISDLRKKANLTQGELALALGLTRQAVIAWEQGKSRPRLYLPQAKELCRVLKTKLKDIEDYETDTN